jgi:DNA-binding CsgD family transcriptional regulator
MFLKSHTPRQKEILGLIFLNPFISHSEIEQSIGSCSKSLVSFAIREYFPSCHKRISRLQFFDYIGYIKPLGIIPYSYKWDSIQYYTVKQLVQTPSASYQQLADTLGYSMQSVRQGMLNLYRYYDIQARSTLFTRLRLYERVGWFDVDQLRDDFNKLILYNS